MAKRTGPDPLLAECESYFLDGVLTAAAFAQRTQELVSGAVERHKAALAKALGFPEDEITVVDYCDPDKLQKTKPDELLYLGAKLKFSNVFESAIYRYWGVDEKPGIAFWIWIKPRTALHRLTRELDSLPDEPPGPADFWDFEKASSGTYYASRDLAESDIGELDLRLDELIAYYILLVTKAGGVQKFLSVNPNSAA